MARIIDAGCMIL